MTVQAKLTRFLGFHQFYPLEEIPPNIPSDTEPFFEYDESSTVEFLKQHRPTLCDVRDYFYRLFPFIDWIGKYNWAWFLGDLIAG